MQKIITIIVTYNGEKWIRACIDCLEKSTLKTEILVIDNASSDNTVSIIKNEYPGVELVESTANLGFGMANNIGLEKAIARRADAVFLLNQDAYVEPATLEVSLALQNSYPVYGIVCPLQLNGNGDDIDHLFKRYIGRGRSPQFVKDVLLQKATIPPVIDVRFANAAAWLISARCLHTVGLFHPIFPHYGEDNQYSSRAQYHGFKIGISTKTAVRHDREPRNDQKEDIILRQINIVPLYILLDIRKPFWLTKILAAIKMSRFNKKAKILASEKLSKAITEKKKLGCIQYRHKEQNKT